MVSASQYAFTGKSPSSTERDHIRAEASRSHAASGRPAASDASVSAKSTAKADRAHTSRTAIVRTIFLMSAETVGIMF